MNNDYNYYNVEGYYKGDFIIVHELNGNTVEQYAIPINRIKYIKDHKQYRYIVLDSCTIYAMESFKDILEMIDKVKYGYRCYTTTKDTTDS